MTFTERQNKFWTELLRKEFVKRCDQNKAYSMRAFASYLGVDQSLLSKIFSSERNVSAKTISLISSKLQVNPYEFESLNSFGSYNFLKDEDFSLLDHWYYFAILEMFKLKDFRAEEVYISEKLGIHKQESLMALERLEKHGFLVKEGETLKLSKENNSWVNKKSTVDKKTKLQQVLTEKAVEALETVPFEERDSSSLTVAINTKQLDEIKDRITQFRRELDDYIQKSSVESEGYDEIYQMVVSFFPVTKLKNKEGLQ